MTQEEVDEYCESVVHNPNGRGVKRKLKLGAGINDLPHIAGFTDAEGKVKLHSGYSQWCGMLMRAYSKNYKVRCPTYVGVSICDEWLKASNFIEWQKAQYREDGWELEKDLLSIGNKVYSPETCIYVPPWLNKFTTDRGSKRGKYLIGTYWNKGASKFAANCGNPITGKQEYLGYFDNELDAHLAWKKYKLGLALELKPKMDAIDLRIYPNVVTIINNAQ